MKTSASVHQANALFCERSDLKCPPKYTHLIYGTFRMQVNELFKRQKYSGERIFALGAIISDAERTRELISSLTSGARFSVSDILRTTVGPGNCEKLGSPGVQAIIAVKRSRQRRTRRENRDGRARPRVKFDSAGRSRSFFGNCR